MSARTNTAQRVTQGRALRDEIRALLAMHVGPGAATAERLRLSITRKPAPSLRTVQRHLQAIRREAHSQANQAATQTVKK